MRNESLSQALQELDLVGKEMGLCGGCEQEPGGGKEQGV